MRAVQSSSTEGSTTYSCTYGATLETAFRCLTIRLEPLSPLPPQLIVRLPHSGLPVTLLARLAICNHLPLAECAHFGQHKTAKALYDAVVARYSSPATAALGRLILPYLFPEISAFATVEDLITHLRTNKAPYHAALPAEFLDRKTPPPLSGVDIFDLDYDAILAAMYALSVRSEGDSYLCVPPDPGIEAAALGASESAWLTPQGAQFLPVRPQFSRVRRYVRLTVRSSPPLVLYELATSAQVSAPGLVAPPFSCRLLSHQTLLWHHRPCHPSLPRLRGMQSRLLVSGLPRSLPPLSPSPASPCLHCVEGRQRAAPYSSSFPLTSAPLHTLHMDVSGPAHVSGQGRERYFLLVVDDYMPYTTVFPLRSKGEVPDVLIPWIRAVRLQLHERFRQDLPVLRLHCDRGGEFSSDLLRDFCHGEGILQSFMLPASPQQNGIAERCIGLVMEFYHPTSRHVLPSQDVTFDESVPFYCLFPYRSAPLPPPPLFHAPGPPLVDPLPLQGRAPSGVSQVDPLPSTVPVEVAVDLGAAIGLPSGGAEPAGTEPGGAESECAGFGGAEPGGAEPGGAEPGGAEPTGAEPGSAESEGAETGGA
ncbi:unnamed protein product [Closterium sp. NIES-53]